MPRSGLRSSLASLHLRYSIDDRRRSSPSSSIRSKATGTPHRRGACDGSGRTRQGRRHWWRSLHRRSGMTALAGRAVTAATMTGNRLVKSLPWRAISRTLALSRQAMIRKPSCLISCSQPGPLGGALAGRHGSIMPSPGRVRSLNDMVVVGNGGNKSRVSAWLNQISRPGHCRAPGHCQSRTIPPGFLANDLMDHKRAGDQNWDGYGRLNRRVHV